MSTSYPSANMGLPVPSVGIDPGPDYASNVNASLTLVDAHDHSAGKGVQITPAGLNINSDLSLAQNNLTNARSLRLVVQSASLALATDLNCLFDVSGDLYFNDGSGNHVRITQSGGVAGSPGSIAGLASPASATYVSGSSTFVWQSAANTPANMDNASVILRNLTASSKGLTLAPPSAMASDYSIVLPSLPGSTKLLSIDASGNMGSTIYVDNSTVEIAANNIQVKNAGITAAKMATNSIATASIQANAVTFAKMAAPNTGISGSCGGFSTASTSPVDVTALLVTLTVSGSRSIQIIMQPDGTSAASSNNTLSGNTFFRLMRDTSVELARWQYQASSQGFMGLQFIDYFATAGSHSWGIQAWTSSGTLSISNWKLTVLEI